MADGTLKVGTITTSSGSGTITIGQSGETVTIPSGATFSSGTTSTWTSTISYSTTLTSTSADATTTVTGNYYNLANIYFFSLPTLTRDSTFSGSDVLIFSFTSPVTVGSTVDSRNIVGGYKVQGRYSSTDMTDDGQTYWESTTGSSTMSLVYQQMSSSGTGFIRLNGSGADLDITGSFIGA